MGTDALQFRLLWAAGWVNHRQLEVVAYLKEENHGLREQSGWRQLRVTDDKQRRLAIKGGVVGRRRLSKFAGSVTPETILRCYRDLLVRKYDSSARCGTGHSASTTAPGHDTESATDSDATGVGDE